MNETFQLAELDQAKRNHALPLEALRYPITPPGLHYLLSHYDIQAIDPAAWRLSIGGLVERPRTLTLAELRACPAVEHVVTMECAGNGRGRVRNRPLSQPWFEDGVGTARWRGASLRRLLDEAGVRADAVELVFAGPDRGIEAGAEHAYERSLSVEDALASEAILAYEMNGEPLLPQHGAPVRLLVPGWYGMANVKWIVSIDALAEPFRGHHQSVAYVLRNEPDEEGVPVRRIQPRALMIPPGIPGFPERTRTVDSGPCLLEGRAWSGEAAVAAVEVSVDGGVSWEAAELVRDLDSPWAWSAWRYSWRPDRTGEYELCCRARDEAGNEQPLEPVENLGGYVNNGVQRVNVTVRG